MVYFIQQLTNGAVFGVVLGLFALGYGLVVANLRVFNVAHEGAFVWSATAAYFLIAKHGWPLALAWPASMLVGAAVNLAVYLLAVRHLERRRDKELAAFVSTVGALTVLLEIANISLHRQTVKLPPGTFPQTVWNLAGIRVTSVQLLTTVAALIVFALLWYLIERTAFGRQLRAVAFDRGTASLLGINASRMTVAVFVMAGLLAGVAAIPIALSYNVISSDMGSTYVVLAISIMVIGGFGSVAGTFLAGLFAGILTSLTSSYLTSSYRDVIVYSALIGILLLRPQGLFSRGGEAIRA